MPTQKKISKQTLDFINSHLRLKPDEIISLTEMHKLYSHKCESTYLKPVVSIRSFSKEVKLVFEKEIQDGSILVKNSGPTRFHGLTMVTDSEIGKS